MAAAKYILKLTLFLPLCILLNELHHFNYIQTICKVEVF